MVNARSSQEFNNDNAPQLNKAREAFSIHMRSIPDPHQLVGFEYNADKALMMFLENLYPSLHDLMDKIRTEGLSAPGDLPNKSEQTMIDAI